MKPERRIEEMVRGLHESAGAETHDRILGHLLEVLKRRTKPLAGGTPTFRRTVMRNPITRLAAAAVLVIMAGLLTTFMVHTTPRAYGLDQTIEANGGIRSIHVIDFDSEHEEEPKEFWITCDEQGQIENVRYYMPAWDAPEDGAKSIVWNQGVAQVWFHKKNSLLICRNKTILGRMSAIVQQIGPRHAIDRLSEQQKQGQLTLEIEQPPAKNKPVVVTATYLPGSASPGRREVLYVDQATRLVIAARFYRLGDNDQYVYLGRQEYHDYNAPIAAGYFTLENEVPAGIIRVDQVAQDVGLAQGTLSDEEVAMEVVRRFFEAIRVRDYDTAGILWGGVPADKMQEWFGQWDVVRVVSVETPKPHPEPEVGGFVVPCEIELRDAAGNVRTRRLSGVCVRPIDMYLQQDRWGIHGGI